MRQEEAATGEMAGQSESCEDAHQDQRFVELRNLKLITYSKYCRVY